MSNAVKRFNIFLAISTILNGYSLFVSRGISITMVLISLYAVYNILLFFFNRGRNRNNIHVQYEPLVYFTASLLISSLSILLNFNSVEFGNVIYEVLKLGVWAIIICFGGYYLFNYPLFFRYMKYVVLISFIFLCIQYILHNVVHVNVTNGINLGIIVPFTEGYAERTFSATSKGFRPGSFWVEPSFLGYYYNLFLVLALLDENIAKKELSNQKRFYISIACLGNIMTFSSGAIAIMAVVFILRLYKKSKRNALILFAAIALLIISIQLFINYVPYYNWGTIGTNINYSVYKLNHLDQNTRTGASFHLLDDLTTGQKLIGLGVGNIKQYISAHGGYYANSVVTVILWTGYFGLSIFAVLFLGFMRRHRDTLARVSIIIIYLLEGLFAGNYFGPNGILYLIVALYAVNASDSFYVSDT